MQNITHWLEAVHCLCIDQSYRRS